MGGLPEQLGGEAFVYLDVEVAEGQVVIKVAGESCPMIGETVGIAADFNSFYLFDPKSDVCTRTPESPAEVL